MVDETAVLEIDTAKHDELEAKMKDAAGKGDWKAVRQVARELEDLDKTEEKARKEQQIKVLADITLKVKQKIDGMLQKMIDNKELDFADGIWYSQDFGTTDTACRLMKSAPRKAGTGTGSGSYISRPEKTSDLLAQVGDNVMFAEDTQVTIDKVEQTMVAGTTFKQAYEHSNNGGWRNRVRMAILKEAGLV